jgi:hypothetical protein
VVDEVEDSVFMIRRERRRLDLFLVEVSESSVCCTSGAAVFFEVVLVL